MRRLSGGEEVCRRSVCFIYSFPGFENRWLCVCRAEVCVNCLARCWWLPSNDNNGIGGEYEQQCSLPFQMTRKQTGCSLQTQLHWQPAGLRPVLQTRDAGQPAPGTGRKDLRRRFTSDALSVNPPSRTKFTTDGKLTLILDDLLLV